MQQGKCEFSLSKGGCASIQWGPCWACSVAKIGLFIGLGWAHTGMQNAKSEAKKQHLSCLMITLFFYTMQYLYIFY